VGRPEGTVRRLNTPCRFWKRGSERYGAPQEILTDNGTQFVSTRDPETADPAFRKFLEYHGVRHIWARVNHPQADGKIERSFCEVEWRIQRFGTIDEVVTWHNEIYPHSSLDYGEPPMPSGNDYLLDGSVGMLERWVYAEG